MSVLVGGATVNQWGPLGSGLAAGNGIIVAEVVQTPIDKAPSLLAPTDMRMGGGARFRRHLNGITTDATNAPLGSVTMDIHDTNTDALVATGTSGADGIYDFPIYNEGTTYKIYAKKAGSPNVFGASDDNLVPV